MKYTILFLLVFAIGFSTSHAQTEPASPTLLSPPKVEQPQNGYEPGGAVRVRVDVNELGEVTNATFWGGPGAVCSAITRPDVVLARETALTAARRAKFRPAMSNGVAVASTANISVELSRPKLGIPKDDDDMVLKWPLREASTLREHPELSLTRKAISLPKPKYPSTAKASRASGVVFVVILIEKNGSVFSAKAAGGNPLFQPAAVTAACKAKFSSTILEGQPVGVSGIIGYSFVP